MGKALDTYAQDVLDYIHEHAAQWSDADDPRISADADGWYYNGSLHILAKEISPRAQPAELVRRLETTGCVANVKRGVWKIIHDKVLDGLESEDTGINGIKLPVETPLMRRMSELEARVARLEEELKKRS